MHRSAETVAQENLPIGTLQTTWKRCGKPGCKCERGQLHGPYYRRMFRDESGRQRAVYVKRGDVERVRGEVERARAVRLEAKQVEREAEISFSDLLRNGDKYLRQVRRQTRAMVAQYFPTGYGKRRRHA